MPADSGATRLTIRHDQEHQDERRQEHQPARELVEEPLRRALAVVVREHAGTGHADGVGGNGDRDCRRRNRHADPGAVIRKVAVYDAQRQQRDQRPDAAAGLGHLERRVREDDDVALAEHGDGARLDAPRADPRREELQRKRNLIEDDRGQRHHQQQERKRKRQDPEMRATPQEQRRAGQHHDQRDAREKQLSAEEARDEQHQPDRHDRQPGS